MPMLKEKAFSLLITHEKCALYLLVTSRITCPDKPWSEVSIKECERWIDLSREFKCKESS